MRKILTGLITIISLILMVSNVSASGIGELGVFIPPEGGPVTEEENAVMVSIVAKDIDSIGSLQLTLSYDPDVLIARNVTRGDLLKQDVQFSGKIENGNISIGIGKTGGFSATEGSIAIIEFLPLGDRGRGMSTPLNITLSRVYDYTDKDIPFSGINIINGVYPSRVPGAGANDGPIGGIPTTIETVQETETPRGTEETPAPTETQQAPGFDIMLTIGAILTIFVIYLRKK